MSRRIFRYSAAALLLAVGPAACVDDASEPGSSGPAVEDTQVADAQATPTTADQELKPVDFDLTELPTGTLVWEFEGFVDRESGTIEFMDVRRVHDAAQHASGLRTAEQAGYCAVDADNDGTAGSGAPDTVELVTNPATYYAFDPFTWAPGAGCDASTNNNASPSEGDFVPNGVECADVTVRSFYGVPLNDVHVQITQFGGNGNHLAYPAASVPDGLPSGAAALGLWAYGDLEADGGANASTQTWYFRNADETPFFFSGVVIAEIDEVCGDIPALDDDCDGRANEGCYEFPDGADCEDDSDCLGALCDGGTCGLGCWTLSAGSDTGENVVGGDWSTASPSYSICSGTGADEAVRFVAPADGSYIFDTYGSTGDTVLAVYENDDQSCSASASLGCRDGTPANLFAGPSELDPIVLTAGQEVLIIVKAYGSTSGNWQLNIEAPAVCGDGVISTGEECDDGAGNSDVLADACRTDCTNYGCGDGVVDSNEDCEVGDANCSTLCLDLGPIPCSEGYIGSDVGDAVYSVFSTGQGDDYTSSCTVGGAANSGDDVAIGWTAPSTGDFIISTLNSDASDFDTVMEIIEVTGESPASCQNGDVGGCVCTGTSIACDDDSGGTWLSEFTLSATAGTHYLFILDTSRFFGESYTQGQIQLDITPIVCGDGVILGSETCDDGNTTSGDGCSDLCAAESGWDCTGEPSVCAETCGNSTIDAGEDCDLGADRDDDDGDGCQADCSQEPGAQYCADDVAGTLSTGDAPYVIAVDNPGSDDDQGTSGNGCYGSAPDATIYFTAGSTGDYTVILDGTYDGMISVRADDGTCDGAEDTCTDVGFGGDSETVVISATAGESFVIVAGPYSQFSTGTGTLTIAPEAICGDGVIGYLETCDDGGTTPGDGCSDTCLVESPYVCTGEPSVCAITCGNGVIDAGETCDDGGTTPGDGCSDTCATEAGFACAGEPSVCACGTDVGSVVGAAAISGDTTGASADFNSFTCTSSTGPELVYRWTAPASYTATFDACGFDTTLYIREAVDNSCGADDGSFDACNGDGAPAGCGISFGSSFTYAVTAGTEYLIFVDGWDGDFGTFDVSISEPPVCGDGVIAAGEDCDDGGTGTGDGCDNLCQIEAGYECTGAPSTCGLICSNGVIDAGEFCDDGNTSAGDGCDAACAVEVGYSCTGEPSVCAATCGDGFDDGEECDDGNNTDGDGCSAACTTEDGYVCTGFPSSCACDGTDIGSVFTYSGDTTSTGDRFTDGAHSCQSNTDSNDEVLYWTAPATYTATFDMDATTGFGDSVLIIYPVAPGTCGDFTNGNDLLCDDDGGQVSFLSEGTLAVTAGTQYAIVIDGFGGSNEGAYQIDISPPIVCGDSIIATPTENCDDGNASGGDGCSAACTVEVGYSCTGTPSVCAATCGNGVDDGEACDDGNNTDGDGCSAACTVEGEFTCVGFPSVCACGGATIVGGATDIGSTTGTSAATGNTSGGTNTYNGGTGGGGHTCQSNTASNDEVLIWTAPASYTPTFDLSSSAISDTVMSIREVGAAVCNPTVGDQVACDDDDGSGNRSLINEYAVTAGQTYAIIIDGWSSGNNGAWQLDITDPPVCGDGALTGEQCDDGNTTPGDGCSDTCTIEPGFSCSGTPSTCVACDFDQDIGSATGNFTGTTTGATANHTGNCSSSTGEDIVLRWTAPSTGTAYIETCDSDYDTTLYVRTGATCGTENSALVCGGDDLGPGDGCGSFTSEVTFAVTAGSLYYIYVDGWSGDDGNYDLDITVTP